MLLQRCGTGWSWMLWELHHEGGSSAQTTGGGRPPCPSATPSAQSTPSTCWQVNLSPYETGSMAQKGTRKETRHASLKAFHSSQREKYCLCPLSFTTVFQRHNRNILPQWPLPRSMAQQPPTLLASLSLVSLSPFLSPHPVPLLGRPQERGPLLLRRDMLKVSSC